MFNMKKGFILGIFLLFSILVLLNNNFPPVSFLAGVIQNIFVFPKSVFYQAKTGIIGEDIPEIKKLKDENNILRSKLAEYQRVKKDNEALKSQFETGTNQGFNLMPARVIGFLGSFSKPNALIIDLGKTSGIKKNMAVISGVNLVGKINFVSSSYSQVLLPQNSSFSTLGKTDEGQVLGVVSGKEDFILFERVSVNEKITIGETLLSKGEVNQEGVGIPPDLVIGKVESVNKNESLPFQTAKIESLLSFPKLSTVFVIKSL